MGTKKIKRTKGTRPKVSSHLNVGTAVTSTTDADARRTLNHKMAKRRRQPNHQLRTRPLPRPSRAGLSKHRLSTSTIIRVRVRCLRATTGPYLLRAVGTRVVGLGTCRAELRGCAGHILMSWEASVTSFNVHCWSHCLGQLHLNSWLCSVGETWSCLWPPRNSH